MTAYFAILCFYLGKCPDKDLILKMPGNTCIAMASSYAVFSFSFSPANLRRPTFLNFCRPIFECHCPYKAFSLEQWKYHGFHYTDKGASLVRERLGADQTLVARVGDSGGEEDTNLIPEMDLSVFRFTLGIPGYDESNLPRLIGIICGFLLGLNHFLTQNSTTAAQLRSEAVGIALAAIAISLPYAGKRLKGSSVTRQQNFSADGRQVFMMSENLSDADKEDLAWGSYALLRNTSTMSVVLCARGCWDAPAGASKDDMYGWFKSEIEQMGFSYLTTTLYFPKNADEQGWKIMPKGATSLLVQPFTCRFQMDENTARMGGFILLVSSIPEAYRDKDQAWVAALANKFGNIQCNMPK